MVPGSFRENRAQHGGSKNLHTAVGCVSLKDFHPDGWEVNALKGAC
jgi:hypothetical protein